MAFHRLVSGYSSFTVDEMPVLASLLEALRSEPIWEEPANTEPLILFVCGTGLLMLRYGHTSTRLNCQTSAHDAVFMSRGVDHGSGKFRRPSGAQHAG